MISLSFFFAANAEKSKLMRGKEPFSAMVTSGDVAFESSSSQESSALASHDKPQKLLMRRFKKAKQLVSEVTTPNPMLSNVTQPLALVELHEGEDDEDDEGDAEEEDFRNFTK